MGKLYIPIYIPVQAWINIEAQPHYCRRVNNIMVRVDNQRICKFRIVNNYTVSYIYNNKRRTY